jgi:F-type H+-transporting ATPase subunit delta
MRSPAVASRYAGALLDVVLDPKHGVRPDQLVTELRSFQAVLDSSAELRTALASPAVPVSRKRGVIGRIAGILKLGPISRNLLLVLISRRRMDALAAVLDSFEGMLDERLGFSRGEVISARALDARQQAQLQEELTRLTGKTMRLRFAVDAALIGGVVARIGSTVYDGSVRGRLQALARQLNAG